MKFIHLQKRNKSNKRKFGDAFKDSVFASAEEFAELLEEPDYNDGGSHALSNKDRAGDVFYLIDEMTFLSLISISPLIYFFQQA